jgi:hypothetical protein
MRCISDGRTLNTGEGIQADEQKREREREREGERAQGLHQLNSIYSIRALLYSVSRRCALFIFLQRT